MTPRGLSSDKSPVGLQALAVVQQVDTSLAQNFSRGNPAYLEREQECLVHEKARFPEDGVRLPCLGPQAGGEDPQLRPKRSLPLKNPETR